VADRHKDNPIPFRPPAGDRAWLKDYAKRTGQAVNAILSTLVSELRSRVEKEDGQ
jgi:hypothetical protein